MKRSSSSTISVAPRAKELPDASDLDVHVLIGGLCAHRKRQDLPADALGFHEAWVFEAEVLVVPERFRPVDERFDATRAEMLAQPVATPSPHDVVLEDVRAVCLGEVRQPQRGNTLEACAIARTDAPTVLDPVRQMR